MIVLKPSSEIIILKICRIASFWFKSAKFCWEHPFPKPHLFNASASLCAACGGDVTFNDDYLDFAPPPPTKT